ncbi:MAG: carboxypeptidase regulatory-like domain-containing protein, partial [Actinomycetales bacterium]
MRRSLAPVRIALAVVSALVVVATMLAAPSAQAASGDGSVSGRIVDQNGVPAQWYTVSLERYTDTTTQVGSVRTDADGRFSFSSLPDGDYGFNSLCEEE